MRRRLAHLPNLLLVLLTAVSPLDIAMAATRCDDSAVFSKLAPMSTVVSSASTRAVAERPDPAADKRAVSLATSAPAANSSPTTAGGGVAAGGSEGGVLGEGGAPAGAHKRGLRWQSFLPGMIR